MLQIFVGFIFFSYACRTHILNIRKLATYKISHYIYGIQYCISTRKLRRKVCVLYMAFVQLYIEHLSRKDYVIQEKAWSSSSSTSQRINQANSKVYLGYTSKSIYIVTNFHASDELCRGPEFSCNYLIDYLIGYIMISVSFRGGALGFPPLKY